MTTRLVTKRGNYGYDFTFTVRKADNSVRTLTGYTVKFRVWDPEDEDTLLLNGTCTVTDAANGICTYSVQSGDFPTSGAFSWDLELTASGIEENTDTGDLVVKSNPS